MAGAMPDVREPLGCVCVLTCTGMAAGAAQVPAFQHIEVCKSNLDGYALGAPPLPGRGWANWAADIQALFTHATLQAL